MRKKKPAARIVEYVMTDARVGCGEEGGIVVTAWCRFIGDDFGVAPLELSAEDTRKLVTVLGVALAAADTMPAGVRMMDLEAECDR